MRLHSFQLFSVIQIIAKFNAFLFITKCFNLINSIIDFVTKNLAKINDKLNAFTFRLYFFIEKILQTKLNINFI